MDFESISDADLRQELVARGATVGPVGPSTRGIYIKKLQKLIDEQEQGMDGSGDHATHPVPAVENTVQMTKLADVPASPSIYPTLDIDEPTETATPVVERELRARKPRHASPPVAFVHDRHSDNELAEGSDMEGEESMRILEPHEIVDVSARRSPVRSQAGSGAGAKVLFVIGVLAALVFVFFLVDHASKATSNGNHETL